jgi:hypothetical protein
MSTDWVIFVIIVLALLVLGLFVIFFLKFFRNKSTSLIENQEIPVSGTPIDLSVFDEICEKEGDDGRVDFSPISEDDSIMIKALFSRERRLTRELLKRNPIVRIVYTDNKGEKTVRDMMPYRVVGSVLQNTDGTKEYDFYIEAFCLYRNQERSFHTNGISAAWSHGREINLGDYLASLFRKTKKK